MTQYAVRSTQYEPCLLIFVTMLAVLCLQPVSVQAEFSLSTSSANKLRVGAQTGGGGRTSDGRLESTAGQGAAGVTGSELHAGLQPITNIPPVVSDLSPIAGSKTEDENPTFSWTYSDAEGNTQAKYQVQISRNNFISILIDSGIVSSSSGSYKPGNMTEGEGYVWRVRAFDGFDWSGYAELSRPFTVSAVQANPPIVNVVPPPEGEEGDGKEDSPVGFSDPSPQFLMLPAEVLSLTPELLALVDLFEILEENNILQMNYELRNEAGTLFNEGAIKSRRGLKLSDFTVAFENLADDYYVLKVITIYKTGKQSAETLFYFMIDTVAPVITVLNPLDQMVLGVGEVKPHIKAGVFDATSGANRGSIQLTVDTSETLEMSVEFEYEEEPRPPKTGTSGVAGYQTYNPPFGEGLPEGLVSVSLTVSDILGNEAHQVWQFLMDMSAPTGTLLINEGSSETYSTLVTLRIDARWGEEEAVVTEIKIRNDDLNFAVATWQPFAADEPGGFVMHKKWVLKEEAGLRSVYVRLRDAAGNESSDTVIKDSITLVIQYPDTFITSGPSGVVEETEAAFTFYSSREGSLFKTKIDNQPWSEWNEKGSAAYSALELGNHYFQVKAGKDVNQDGVIAADEEDPVPATRSWVVGPYSIPETEGKPPVRFWRRE